MKMAKASKEDFQRVIRFFQLVEEYMDDRTYTPPTEDDSGETIDLDDAGFIELLREMWGGRFKPPGVLGSWSRVVHGGEILIENCCDPNSEVLDWKPEIAAAIKAFEGNR